MHAHQDHDTAPIGARVLHVSEDADIRIQAIREALDRLTSFGQPTLTARQSLYAIELELAQPHLPARGRDD